MTTLNMSEQKTKRRIAAVLSKIFIAYFRLRYKGRVNFGKNIIVNHKFKIAGKGKLIIGDNSNLWAHEEKNSFHFYGENGTIKIGANSRLNGITCHCEESIEIGESCLIGSTTIMDTDFHTFSDNDHILFGNQKTKPIKIGNEVWICGQSVILKGCSIGDKTVIAFRAVVAKSFPGNVVIAGNPAKIIKSKE